MKFPTTPLSAIEEDIVNLLERKPGLDVCQIQRHMISVMTVRDMVHKYGIWPTDDIKLSIKSLFFEKQIEAKLDPNTQTVQFFVKR